MFELFHLFFIYGFLLGRKDRGLAVGVGEGERGVVGLHHFVKMFSLDPYIPFIHSQTENFAYKQNEQ